MKQRHQWISAKRELPQPFVTVLIHTPEFPHDPVHIGYYDRLDNHWRDAHGGILNPGTVTHWRDLPNTPSK